MEIPVTAPYPGTYLKTVRFEEPTNPDAHLVLYLRPAKTFLFLGYWSGYERSAAAGTWRADGSDVVLTGRGEIGNDTLSSPNSPLFERRFRCEVQHSTPLLQADDELEGWSLLSWRGPFIYIGEHFVIEPAPVWFPRDFATIDSCIARLDPPVAGPR